MQMKCLWVCVLWIGNYIPLSANPVPPPDSDTTAIKIISTTEEVCPHEQITLAIQKAIVIGDILCTDGSIVKRSKYTQSRKTAKGIVFWIDHTDLHGWAVDLRETILCQWSIINIDIPDLVNEDDNLDDLNRDAIKAYRDTAGYTNTRIIRAFGTPESHPAAYAVDFQNGWYLPAARQLHFLQPQFDEMNISLRLVGGTPIRTYEGGDFCWYWSSTEVSDRKVALGHDLWFIAAPKDSQERVRAVCNF